jgi:hypothetical protein
MAKTFRKQALAVAFPSDAYLGYVSVNLPEGASQTFVSSAPVLITAGLIVEAANPVAAAAGVSLIALEAGHNNGVAGAVTVKVIPCYPGLVLLGNLLGAAGVDNVLAVADLGANHTLARSATLLGATSPGWFFEDAAGVKSIKITNFASDQRVPNSTETIAVAGDTNARLTGEVLTAANGYLV